jgi:hypothetical protein
VHTLKATVEAGVEQALLEGLSCPISFQLMTDPVVAEDGHTYEQAAIQEWIDKCRAGEPRTMGERSPFNAVLCPT